MTIGSKVGFPGESVPLHGNSEIRQSGSTAVDVVTITLATGVDSTTGGKGLVISRYTDQNGGPSSGNAIFEVEYDGTREMRHIVAIPTDSTTYTPAASQSGALFTWAGSSPLIVTLPTAAAGLWYEFITIGACTSGVLVQGATANMMIGYNDVALTSIQWGASGLGEGGGLRVVGAANVWYAINEANFTSAAPTSLTATDYDYV